MLAGLLVACFLGCGADTTSQSSAIVSIEAPDPVALSPETERQVEAFCGDCHPLPRPESFARDRWHYEVRRGYEFYAKSGRNDLQVPPLQQTLAYFRQRAPEHLVFPAVQQEEPSPVPFKQERFYLESGAGVLPEIAHLRWTALAEDEAPVLLATDIRYGHVVAIDVRPKDRQPPQLLAQLRNPCRIEACDLDGDGLVDLLVSDLGSYLPSEHDRGRVVLLHHRPGTARFEGKELVGDLARVSDVRAADLDGDGQLELIVAEFGWRETGQVRLGTRTSKEELRFDWQTVDDRPGAIDLRVHDFTGDGRLDFVTMFSQWYESIDLFQNVGHDARRWLFARRNLWAAADLTFGLSGIELVDLNQDGQMDILYTNGDSFDNDYVTPWHGVQWLENQGDLRFDYHRLLDMPGAYRALPADFDQDGRLDVIVGARLPSDAHPASLRASRLASIVLLTQTEANVFTRHTLEWDSPYYPTLEVADFDSDGDPDFAVASGPYVAEARAESNETHYLTVWWNQMVSQE